MTVLWVGVDMASREFTASVWNKRTVESDYLGSFANDALGFAELKERLKKERAKDESIQFVIEATGGYEKQLVFYAYKNEWGVCMPNAMLVREFARSSGQRNKSDRADANILAQYGAERTPAAQRALPVAIFQLEQLLQRRLQLEKMAIQERYRFMQFCQRPLPNSAVQATFEASIEGFVVQLAMIKDAIKALLNAHPEHKQMVKRLRTVPGVGPKNSLPLLVFLHRFCARIDGVGNTRKVTAFCGLDPKEFSSGGKSKRPTISKMGDCTMRRYLYMGALGGIRGNNPLRTFYLRLVTRGKAKRLAMTAAARKILVWAFKVFTDEIDFDPLRHRLPQVAA